MRAWDSSELELQVIVGSHVVAGNKTHSPSIFFFLTTESCPKICGYVFYIIPSFYPFLSSSGKTFEFHSFYYL